MRPMRLAVVAALFLGGCSAGSPTEGDPGATTAGAQVTDSAPSVQPSGTPSQEEHRPDAEESTDPPETFEPAPSAEDWVAPDECLAMDLQSGTVLDGASLGACVATALRSYGSGRELVTSADFSGVAEFTYTPELSLRMDVDSGAEQFMIVLTEDDVWMDLVEGKLVKGDPNGDPQAQLVAGMGELYRFFSSPDATASLMAASPAWDVLEPEERTLPDGSVVTAVRLEAAAPFSWMEVQVDAYSLWFTPEWTPVGAQGTSTMAGISGTTLQEFYDLGADITIEPPA